MSATCLLVPIGAKNRQQIPKGRVTVGCEPSECMLGTELKTFGIPVVALNHYVVFPGIFLNFFLI